MSLFKKPKKNIRRRVVGDDDDGGVENDDKMDVEDGGLQVEVNVNSKEKKESKKQSILSFEEEWNDADDGEVFQVKKSNHSKKIMKLLDRERKKKKEMKKEDEKVVNETEKTIVDETSDLVLVVKNTEMPRVLNGREAEVAGVCEDISSEEDENGGSGTRHKFSAPDHVKLLLESGRIPDAATIHAARKRRQLARELGGTIPLETFKKNEKSRLVREEDEGSDEERLNMDVNVVDRDLEERRDAFMAAQGKGGGEESDKGEEDDWESQQIRKGVTGAQLAAVQQECLYQQYGAGGPPLPMPPAMPQPEVAAVPEVPAPRLPVPPAGESQPLTSQAVADRLKERLLALKEANLRHTQDRDRVADDLVSTSTDLKELELNGPVLAQRFKFYQELRGYVTDLVECLDEKVPIITNLEQRMLALFKKHADELLERRRQDVQDQAEELSRLSRPGAAGVQRGTREQEEARTRRAAEREGRRTRRRRAREMKASAARHVEGMSSDDELTELEATALRSQREIVESDARIVFEDVVEEFCSVRSILKRFEKWRTTDMDAYKEAYVNLCLPKMLGPIIQLKLISWSPLQEGMEFERYKWYSSLMLYGLNVSQTESSLRQDPDLLLVPTIVEKVILPKMTRLVEVQWDPLSTSQTLRLVGLTNRLVQEHPTLVPGSKHLSKFLAAVIAKMKAAVENDVFIPISSRQVSDSKGSSANVFFQRQFGSAVKLLRNLLSWQGIVGDHVLWDVALNALLNRYLLAALRMCEPVDAVDKCSMIVSTFPRWWFQQSTPMPQLVMFIAQMKTIAQCLDVSIPAGRDAMDQVSKLLQTLQPANRPVP
ncbi:PAX3- and PAX7-binding protein 1 [Bacillus rossius redtenbacheri]|uniref:PAX3- and PAX7-binding protein 1 n=1 Tax=Bacillus rossius redtenbacheri TaxID=93214 RepID=UPI002FDE47B2